MADFEFVQIHNTGTTLLRFPIPKAEGDRSPGTRFAEIKPGEHITTRFLSAVAAFGHPKEQNNGNRRDRTDVYRMLRGQWGFHEGFDSETADQVGEYSSWEAKRPSFKVTTLEGTYIPMILDDPDGKLPIPNDDGSLTPEIANQGGASTDALMALIRKQSDEMAELRALIVAQSSVGPVATDDRSLPQPPAVEPEPKADAPKSPGVRAREKVGA